MPDHRAVAREAALSILLAAIYVGAARLGLLLDAVGGFATLVWPPTGIAIAAIAIGGRRRWPAIWIGACVVNLWTGAPIGAAFGIACGNTIEAVLGAWLLQRPAAARGFADVRTTIGFGLSVSCATVASATIGVLSLLGGDVIATAAIVETWGAWWVGDVLGALVVTPLLLAWRADLALRSMRSLEAGVLAAALVAVTWFVFAGDLTPGRSFQQPYLVFPLLIWAAIRFGPRGATAASLVVAAIAIAATAMGTGPFAGEPLHRSLLALQVFIGFVAITFLILGALAAERSRAAHQAAASRRELEVALRQAGLARIEAEQASAVKTDFLSLVSHELRTPLATLLLQIERLKLELPAEPTTDTLVARMAAQGHRLDQLIASLLEYTRIQRGQLTIASERFAPHALVAECVEELRPEAAGKQLTLTLEATRAPVTFASDAHLIRLIVLHLVTNALKFTQQGGITVRVAATVDGGLRIAVTDTGPGIPPEDRARIFEPFEHVGPVQRKHIPGVGLGLALVRELACALGGSVLIDSELGRGSTFTLRLPASLDE